MKKGFSLVEILVSITIIIIIASFGIQAFATAQQRARLEEDVAIVVQAIRKAQNSALAPSKSETGASDADKLCSMGVEISGSNIRQFYTIILNPSPPTCGNAIYYNPTKTLKYSNINPNNIKFEFIIPFADPTSSQTIILTSLSDNNLKKNITLTNSGLIKVK